MRPCFSALLLLYAPLLCAADHLASIRSGLEHLSIDKSETWRVRELEFAKGGAKFYLTEGVLAFATPVDGHRIAALFTTENVEAGDGEVIALPPVAAERASLARFTKSPNLDEHFSSALLFFGDNTAKDLMQQIHQRPLRPADDLAGDLGEKFDRTLQRSAHEIDVRITQSILDHHTEANTFFYGMMSGKTLGFFDFIYQPDEPDPVVFGQVASPPRQPGYFQMWAAYQPPNMPEMPVNYHVSDYHADIAIAADLSMRCAADFDYQADSDDGSVITLLLTPRMQVTSATIDKQPAAVLMHDSARTVDVRGATRFLLINGTDLAPGTHHHVSLQYQGSVIRRSSDGNYFVDDRNAWYPYIWPMRSNFDLTFHCPEKIHLVSTGEPISDVVANGVRTVHRRTTQPQALAGFNLGEFNVAFSESPPYKVEICSNPQAAPASDLAEQTSKILQYFTARWRPLALQNLSVTPIEGYFGQGFPGLIYLSSISYIRESNRPAELRNSMLDSFFTQLLLPHELAHQWWGNIVTATDYRGNWIVEAMSNYAALQYLEETGGHSIPESILTGYRTDLTTPRENGQLVDDYGPVTFDQRLLNNFGVGPWHDILYEKGTWIFHMLRERMGDAAFHAFQNRLLKDFATRTLSNEDLRQEATHFVPANQPDRSLTNFFDTWVYGTGIPILALNGRKLKVSGVPDSYAVDVPLQCGNSVVWQRATQGETQVLSRSCTLPSKENFLFRDSVTKN